VERIGLPHWELGTGAGSGTDDLHWDKADVGTVAATLHCVHNISGLRAGTLPGVSQQNGFLGLPVTLMQEEAAYLVMQGAWSNISTRSTTSQPPLTFSFILLAFSAAQRR
jgi:hypothetical protein